MSSYIFDIYKTIFGVNYLRVLDRLSVNDKEMLNNFDELSEIDKNYICSKFKKIYNNLPTFPYKKAN